MNSERVETEEKTCTLRIDKMGDTGLLYIQNGVLIGAETKNFAGEEAAQSALTATAENWESITNRLGR